MTSENAFTAFAETISPPRKSRRNISARETERREKALQERDCLARAHQRWRKETVATLLAGAHGADAQALIDFLKRVELSDVSAPDSLRLMTPRSTKSPTSF
jgi:ATP sulfurylase